MTASRARLAPLLLLVSLAAVACSGSESTTASSTTTATPPPVTTAKPPATPMGHSYVSTAVEGTPIPGDGPLTLIFAADRLSANAGCNTAAGSVSFDGDNMRVGQLTSTLVGCPPPRADADRWVADLLNAAPAWKLDGSTLTLRTPDRTVTLVDKQVATSNRPLKGTRWIVTGITTPQAHTTSQTITDLRPDLTIAEDGAVTGMAGCNRLTGTARVDPNGSPVTFQVATTKMTCAPEVMEVENAVLKALDGTATTTVEGDSLILRNDNGSGLTFQAAA
ncbi:META domain-containing protein [Nocardia arizonensis]|uniref:META domain-containing protein n=1 Tax=Nocardia arizonensis TaxID=1141647 RepID=UPI0006D03F13|nr:META domain-containing protein [Nocardia arizonensis]